ncbi:putative ABC transporter, permease protein [Treponema primitia ZAS-2]|uniref:Putative ABC transporter, permease protein n=1 Tax=Treponema primitia (strain ATCC BAA-887 / DSM 12427 / ZAS-2) TaxID=545694 RepID=F5YGM6_TREPZ|nr:ABC transporter permease subunit [Treponema primitia]AEF86052.1 putative ABC transporter, permease protein [Treponema primitia ZAS-2]
MISKNWWWSLAGIVSFIALWEIGALAAGSDLIFPGPLPAARRFVELLQSPRFLRALGGSFLRVLLGILLSAPLGMVLGIAAGLDKRFSAFLSPFFSVIAATPVMAVILIAFLVFGSERTPVFTAFLMVFPVMAANAMAGVRAVDPKLRELFALYGLSRSETVRRLYIPAIKPFILGGMRSSLSLCWKVVVASEVLVQPLLALGTGMQRAKAQFETPELFAWTAATVIAAALSEALFTLAATGSGKRRLAA